MKVNYIYNLYTVLFIILTACWGLPSNAAENELSLQDALKIAFSKNPITQANDKRLDAARDRAHGAWLSMLPGASLSFNRIFSDGSNRIDGVTSYYQGLSTSTGVSISINLFRGGSSYYRGKAADLDVKALAATNNSTNALIPDTKGALANDVVDAYINLVSTISKQKFYKFQKSVLTKILKAPGIKPNQIADAENQLQSVITTLETSLAKDLIKYQKNFLYHVKIPAPENINNFDEVIQSIEIPRTAEEAFSIAEEKGPDIRIAKYSLESAQYAEKAQFAESFLPSVDLSFTKGVGKSYDYINPLSQSKGTSVTLSVSIPFDFSRFSYQSATQKETEAKIFDLDKFHERIKHSIVDSLYPDFERYSELDGKYLENFERQKKELEEVIKKIDQGESVNITDVLRRMTGSLEGQYYTIYYNKLSIINTKFNIQKMIGTLFDELGLQNTDFH